jgi:hypothetical protein
MSRTCAKALLEQTSGPVGGVFRDHEALAARHLQGPLLLMLAELIDALPSIIQSAPDPRSDSNGDA